MEGVGKRKKRGRRKGTRKSILSESVLILIDGNVALIKNSWINTSGDCL
jgi:hypothetical protein